MHILLKLPYNGASARWDNYDNNYKSTGYKKINYGTVRAFTWLYIASSNLNQKNWHEIFRASPDTGLSRSFYIKTEVPWRECNDIR